MVIRINGEAVDFTLEQERNLAQVVGALRAWAAGQALAVTSLVLRRHGPPAAGAGGDAPADGELLGRPEEGWERVPVAEVDSLDLTVAMAAQTSPCSSADGTASAAELEAAAAGLEEVEARLTEVPLLLQTGRDRQAMEAVILLSDRLETLVCLLRGLRLAGGTERGRSLEALAAGLNGALRELQASFENRDSVLIGDLLEYEVVPRLAQLRAFAREPA